MYMHISYANMHYYREKAVKKAWLVIGIVVSVLGHFRFFLSIFMLKEASQGKFPIPFRFLILLRFLTQLRFRTKCKLK